MNTAMMKLTLVKNAPHIAVVAGIGALVTSTVLCCRATLRVEELLHETQSDLNMIKEGRTNPELVEKGYDDKAFYSDMAKAYVKSAAGFVKLYGPPIALGLAGLAAILWSHQTMARRNAALMGAYTILQDRFSRYRDNAEKTLAEIGGGVDEKDIFDGVTSVKRTVKEKDDEGNVQKREEVTRILHIPDDVDSYLSDYAWLFNKDTSRMAMGNYTDDLYFLQLAQSEMNDRLHIKGHVFLNEVYDRLGFEHTTEGAVVGWVLDESQPNKIDFGVFDGMTCCMRRIQDGLDYGGIALDFNVDGIIYDLI